MMITPIRFSLMLLIAEMPAICLFDISHYYAIADDAERHALR